MSIFVDTNYEPFWKISFPSPTSVYQFRLFSGEFHSLVLPGCEVLIRTRVALSIPMRPEIPWLFLDPCSPITLFHVMEMFRGLQRPPHLSTCNFFLCGYLLIKTLHTGSTEELNSRENKRNCRGRGGGGETVEYGSNNCQRKKTSPK